MQKPSPETTLIERLRRGVALDGGMKNYTKLQVMDEAADEIERLRHTLQTIAHHRPGTPGLIYQTLDQLIHSATGIAEESLKEHPYA